MCAPDRNFNLHAYADSPLVEVTVAQAVKLLAKALARSLFLQGNSINGVVIPGPPQ